MFERYKTKKEIEKRIKPLTKDLDKIDYLERILSKKNLSPLTRDAIYSKLGELYLKRFNEKWNVYGTSVEDNAFIPLFKSIEFYALAGETDKAEGLFESRKKVEVSPSSENERKKYLTLQEALHETRTHNLLYDKKVRLENLIEKEKIKRGGRWKGGFEKYFSTATATALVLMIGTGIFFLLPNITGNAITELPTKTTWVGTGLLIVGLVVGFFWLKSRRRQFYI